MPPPFESNYIPHPRLVGIEVARLAIDDAEREIQTYQDAIRQALEVTLQHFAGANFGSLEENQQFTNMVHTILERHHLRVACAICGHPSILRAMNSGNAKTGAFLYDHHLKNGRTFHGGPIHFPFVTLVPTPPRRKNKHADKNTRKRRS